MGLDWRTFLVPDPHPFHKSMCTVLCYREQKTACPYSVMCVVKIAEKDFKSLLSFKYACFQDKEHKVHKLCKTFQAGALGAGAEQDPAREHGCAPEWAGWRLCSPWVWNMGTNSTSEPAQMDLGLDASMHQALRSAKLWQIQQQCKLLHIKNCLNGVINLWDFQEQRDFSLYNNTIIYGNRYRSCPNCNRLSEFLFLSLSLKTYLNFSGSIGFLVFF